MECTDKSEEKMSLKIFAWACRRGWRRGWEKKEAYEGEEEEEVEELERS